VPPDRAQASCRIRKREQLATARRVQAGSARVLEDRDGVDQARMVALQANNLPGDRTPPPVWLWCSAINA
jgi:hypothetical protein